MRISCVYFSILICICFIRIHPFTVIHIKSFLIFKFSLETSIEKDSFLQIGSKRPHIALSFSYVSFCRRHYILKTRACHRVQEMHIYTAFSTLGAKVALIFLFVLRGIVFSVPRDNRHYPDTLWFSAENKPTAVSAACREYATWSRQERKVSTVDRANDDDDDDNDDTMTTTWKRKRKVQLYTISERTTKLILFSALTHPSAIFHSPSKRFNSICAPSVSLIRLE